MSAGDAVAWHETIAEDFSRGYERSPAFIERRAVWERLIGDYVGPGDAVLDAGCGAGTFSFIAARRAGSVTGFDGSAAMVALAERARVAAGINNATFRVALLDTLDAEPAARFDVALSSSVLEYLPDLDAELARLARALKPGGRLIVSMPNARSLYRVAERIVFRLTGRPRYFAHVRNVPSAVAMDARLRAAGLTPVRTEFFADPPRGLARVLGRGERGKMLFVTVAVKAG